MNCGRKGVLMSDYPTVDVEPQNLSIQLTDGSPANGEPYRGDELSEHPWGWPKGTWFQKRLKEVREKKLRDFRGPWVSKNERS